MGLLDRLLGDLVAGSTNLPPHVTRNLVRRAGGSKLLLAGGAALAGALIGQHLQSRAAHGAGASQPAVPPPPPPAPPGAQPAAATAPPPPPPAAAAVPGWAPPPLPPGLAGPPRAAGTVASAMTDADDQGTELPAGLLLPVVRTMVAAALADGELEPAEREAVFAHLESGELAPEEVQQVRRDLLLPATPAELAAMVDETEHRELLYRFAFLALRADGELERPEAEWLARLGRELGLDDLDCRELERSVLEEGGAA